MEKKPIKRNDNIVKLSRDHHAALLFCWKLRQGNKYHAPGEQMLNYVQYFWDHLLSHHFQEEEEFLFTPLKDEMVLKAIADHKKIQKCIHELSDTAEIKSNQLLSLADMVDEHVRYEERILFPHLEKELSPDQLEKIGKQISAAPLKDDYENTFWIKPKSL